MRARVNALATAHLSMRAQLRIAGPAHRRALLRRIELVVDTIGEDDEVPPARDAGRADLLDRLAAVLAGADPERVWLALAVLGARLPTSDDVRRAVRAIRLDGVDSAFGSTVLQAASGWLPGGRPPLQVEVVTGETLVDLEHTARAGLATGIQRVARETAKRWVRDHDVPLVGWSDDHTYLRRLTADEAVKALTGVGTPVRESTEDRVVVPWQATYLLPELSPERERNERIAAIGQFARCRTGVIGFDCVPITTAETTALGVSEAFATNLAAVRHVDRLSTISEAAATEYRGWASMLRSVGGQGPAIVPDILPAEAPATTPEVLERVRSRLTIAGMPMVLCVGTHEPRKNHVALLQAAELLWREGVRFSLVLVGGRSWNDARFQTALAGARARNRPVEAVTTVVDEDLWAAYRLARCTVFPSLNEGFGLPIAESLSCGTPVVTSGYGSMAEIAAEGGALLVDPRRYEDIADALRTLVLDDDVHAALVQQARSRSTRTWDDYAADVWRSLTS